MCSKGTNLGPAQQSSAGLLPLEKGGLTVSLRRLHQLTSVAFGATSFPRKEANYQRLRRPFSDSARFSSFRAEVAYQVTLPLKIATAPMSREIFLVNDCDWITTR